MPQDSWELLGWAAEGAPGLPRDNRWASMACGGGLLA